MVDFSMFDEKVNSEQLANDILNASNDEYDAVPAGKYTCSIEKMEVTPTKKGDKLMFSVSMKITGPKQIGRWIFMNRIIYGNRVTEKWNDGKAIKVVIGWLNKLGEEIEFESYSQFANEINEIFDDIKNEVEVEVEYDEDAFNSISIIDCFDI